MPYKVIMRKPKRKFVAKMRRATAPARPIRAPRGARNNGFLQIKRFSNVYDMSGIAVDGAVCSKYNLNIGLTCSSTAHAVAFGTMTCNFKLADVTNLTEFTNLYDSYKIRGVRVELIPYNNVAATAAATSGIAGQPSVVVHSVIDYDDDVALSASVAGLTAIQQYPTYKMQYALGKKLSWYLRPKVAKPVFATAITTGYAPAPFPWVDCSYSDVSSYGLKLLFETMSGGAATVLMYKARCTFYLSFKEPR